VEGSMVEHSLGCSKMGVEGWVHDAGGNAITGAVTVKFQWNGQDPEWWVTGNPMEQTGIFKFDLGMPGLHYHGNKVFTLQIVESQSNPIPLSEPLTWQVSDCMDGPEFFSNIIFRHR
jgi:hypothetical protein